jgi:hypothetical protein
MTDALITITASPSGAHVGIYEGGEQQGGAFIEATDGVIRLTVSDETIVDVYTIRLGDIAVKATVERASA